MRKPDMRPRFTKHKQTIRRQASIMQLASVVNDKSESMGIRVAARQQQKANLTFRIGRTKINTTGFYEKGGKHPIRCK